MGRARQLKRMRRAVETKIYQRLADAPLPPSKTYLNDAGQPFTHREAPSLVWEPMRQQGTLRLGNGEAAIATFLARCEAVGVGSVRLRCATDLASLTFWQHLGWQMETVCPGGATRHRTIARLTRPCVLPLERLWMAGQEDAHA